MRPTFRRKKRQSATINFVRPTLRLGLEPQFHIALKQFAVRYGMYDQTTGLPRFNEVLRFLCVVFLLRNAPDRVSTTVRYALAVEKPMLVSHLGRSLVYEYATRATRKPKVGTYGRQVTLSPGMWLRDQLQALSAPYRDERGMVEDTRMVSEFCYAAINDPALPQIAAQYAVRLNRIRQGLERVREQIRVLLSEAMQDERVARSA